MGARGKYTDGREKGKSVSGIPELLAPAGDLQTAITAIESGADAVYAGLGKFNAREMAHNFTFDEMSRLSAYAKKKQKKLYLTFNTLIKEDELEEAARMLERAVSLEPDAVIVQDIGAAVIIRDYFPSVEIHASTQMGIHNSDGVAAAASMGISRVILERQVTIEELKAIAAKSPIELEVFVHGALCCSLSGRCLFSSWIGGRSGNRGKCKQPCRRRYHTQVDGKKQGSGFFFSTQDLYSLDMLGELTDVGVSSVKIEGRLKKGSYIQPVVSAYRMALDALAEEDRKDLSRAKMVLSDALGRKWTHGFATENDMKEVVQPSNLGVSGLLIGEATGEKRNGGSGEVEVKLKRALHVGDRIRIQARSGDESPSITVTGLVQGNRRTKKVSAGTATIVNRKDINEQYPTSGLLYKVARSVRTQGPSAENLPLFTPKTSVDIEVRVEEGRISAEWFQGDKRGGCWNRELVTEQAKNRELTAEELENVFAATRSEMVKAEKIIAHCEAGLFVPAGELKKARREFWEQAVPGILETSRDSGGAVGEKIRARRENPEAGRFRVERRFQDNLNEGAEKEPITVSVKGGDGESAGENGGKEYLRTISLEEFVDSPDIPREGRFPENEKVEVELPHFTPQYALEGLHRDLRRCYERGIRRFRLTDLAHFAIFQENEQENGFLGDELILSTGYPFPVSNSLAAEECARRGLHRVQAWVELEEGAIRAFVDHNPLRSEIYAYGRPFLLATRAQIQAEGEINDPRGRKFFVEKNETLGLTCIYPYEILFTPEVPGTDLFYDYSMCHRLGEGPKSSFNFDTELV